MVGPSGRGAPSDVDTCESLAIGPFSVTAYRVEKNYRRYVDSVWKPGREMCTPEEIRMWFAHFLTQQVIIAEARRQGYGERKEVLAEVGRMEWHMLSQPEGPLYEQLYAGIPAADFDPGVFYENSKTLYDVQILRLPKYAPVAATVDLHPADGSPADRARWVAVVRESGQAECFEGQIAWPFEPFEELVPVLEKAGPGPWQEIVTSDAILFFQVREIRAAPRPPLEVIKPVIAQIARHHAERQVQLARRGQMLQAVQFSFDWAAAEKVLGCLKETKPDPLQPLSPGMFPDQQTASLGSFRQNDSLQVVTTADYVRYYNDLYLRRIPVTTLDIYSDVQALVVARLDCAEARAKGLAEQSKFREDRENYRNYLALDAFEKERLRPKLNVTDDQVAQYYRDHRADFTHPSRIAGLLVTFAREADALAFVQSSIAGEIARKPERASALTPIILTPNAGVPGLDHLTALIFSHGAPPVIGPFFRDGSYQVWVYQETIDSDCTPLADVAPSIRARLENPLLEQYETELARTISRGIKIEDRIDYKKYGLTEPVVKPWNG